MNDEEIAFEASLIENFLPIFTEQQKLKDALGPAEGAIVLGRLVEILTSILATTEVLDKKYGTEPLEASRNRLAFAMAASGLTAVVKGHEEDHWIEKIKKIKAESE